MSNHKNSRILSTTAHFKPSIILGLIELIKECLNQSSENQKPSNDGLIPFLIFCLILWTLIAFMESFSSISGF